MIAVYVFLWASETRQRRTSFIYPLKIAYIALLLAQLPSYGSAAPKHKTCKNENEVITFYPCDQST
jgi:hypothetical protein